MLKEYYSYMRYEVDYLLVNLVGRKGGAIHDEKVLYRVNNPHSKIGWSKHSRSQIAVKYGVNCKQSLVFRVCHSITCYHPHCLSTFS